MFEEEFIIPLEIHNIVIRAKCRERKRLIFESKHLTGGRKRKKNVQYFAMIMDY